MKTVYVVFAFLLSGCVGGIGMGFEAADGMGINAQKMDAEKIRASADLIKANREKDSQARCVRVPTPWGMGTVLELNVDTAGKMRGKASIAPDCSMIIEGDSFPPPPPAVVK